MSITALTMFDQAAMPAHVARAFGDSTNIQERQSTSALTFRGKTWRLRLDGEEKVLTRQEDGDTVPVSSVKLIILNINPKRSRTFYEGAFKEGENKSPVCWSSSGDNPDKDVKTPFAATCASCPNSIKGSKITESGAEVSACSTLRRLAVVPADLPNMEPLLLKVPQTSLWDKNNPEENAKGFYAWDQYVDFLRSRGVKHTAAVVTKVKFDTTAYPKLLFSADRWLTPEEVAQIAGVPDSEEVKKLLVGKIDESQGEALAEETPVPAVATQVIAKAAAVAAPAVEEDGGFSAVAAPAAVAAVIAKTARATKVAAPASVAKPSAAPAPVAEVGTGASTDLNSLAAAWDD